MRSPEEVRLVLDLVSKGLNDCEIARATAIPRRTILDWRKGRTPHASLLGGPACRRCGHLQHDFTALPPSSYAYLLGMYLGDGCISRMKRPGVFRLRIFLDMRYQGIIEECAWAVLAVLRKRVRVHYAVAGSRMAVISSFSKQWPCLLPQHSAGPKHLRPIDLASWQTKIVSQEPWALLRGLIHSDGCRFVNTVQGSGKTYRYPRYNFTNASDDIRRIFCDACDQVGVEWRRMNARNISVARRESVALMDQFIGPKA